MPFLELYFDKEFLRCFFSRESNNSDIYLDFKSFIRRKSKGIKIFTNYASIKEMKIDGCFDHLIDEGYIPELKFIPNLTDVIQDDSFYVKPNSSPFKMFFIESDCSILIERFGFEFFTSWNLIEKWPLYQKNREGRNLTVTNQDVDFKFDSWKKLREFVHPINGIVLNDQYILLDEPDQRMENNLLKLLRTLLKKASKGVQTNISLFSKKNSTFNLNDCIIDRYERIRESVSKSDLNFSLSLIPDGKHSRFILTNYYYIRCDNSFNFFKDDGSLFFDEPLIEFHFIFNSDKTDHILYEIERLTELKNKAKTYFKTNHNRLLN